MKSFHQFCEQAAAAAPAPAPAATAPKVAKPQAKAKPKVTDPSTGVDIDDKGRWEGEIVDQGKELKPETKVKVKDGITGADPNLPAGEANPNKKRDDEIASADWPTGDPSQKPQPPVQAPWNRWPTVPGGRPFPYPPGGGGSGGRYPMAKNGKGTQIAQGDPRGPMPDYVRDSIRRQYKGGPDYKLEDMKNVINWNKKKA